MKTTGLPMTFFALVFCASSSLYSQNSADMKAINDVIDKYSALEDAGDMMSQAKLMAVDRVWIADGAGRMTAQTMNMALQQAGWDEAKKFVPGVKWFTDARDRLIKFYGNNSVAIASFYWYRAFVLPADTPPEKASQFVPTPPASVTLVLEKKGGGWQIVHTHTSPLAPQANN